MISDITLQMQANFQAITAVTFRAFRYEPHQAIDKADLPAVYPSSIGPLVYPVPRHQAGSYRLTRKFTYRALILPLEAAELDSLDDGAYVDEQTAPILDYVTDYFLGQNPRLESSVLANPPAFYGGLESDMILQDTGMVARQGPGGGWYRAIDFIFQLEERHVPIAPRLS